jgi:hypothetical protein
VGQWIFDSGKKCHLGGSRPATAITLAGMSRPFDLNRTIIEDLYCEALMLADEARSIFDLTPVRDMGDEANQLRLVMSVEGLRTTTRVMHVLAWLLNQRAFFAGELSETQLRRHSKLPPDRQLESKYISALLGWIPSGAIIRRCNQTQSWACKTGSTVQFPRADFAKRPRALSAIARTG